MSAYFCEVFANNFLLEQIFKNFYGFYLEFSYVTIKGFV
jgi:hypothetical protein